MHRRADLWGPSGRSLIRLTRGERDFDSRDAAADEFVPERFLDDRVQKYFVPNPFIFLPFGAGPRICLGQQFAYNEASTVIARIVQAFKSIRLDMDSNPGAKPPTSWAMGNGRKVIEKIWVAAHMTAYARGGVWVKMEEAGLE